MNTDNLKAFFAKCDLNPPVDKSSIDKLQNEIGNILPDSYLEFLQFSNGAEGVLDNGSYVQLWKSEELVDLNKSYEVKEFAPGMLLIGSDGGDEAIGIDLRSDSLTFKNFYKIPFMSLSWKEAILLGPEINNIKII